MRLDRLSELDCRSAMRTNVMACRLQKLSAAIKARTGSARCARIYYDLAATAKNMIELTGRLERQGVGFLCAAGGTAITFVMAYAISHARLSLCDYSAVRFATSEAFSATRLRQKVAARVEHDEHCPIHEALQR